MFSEEAIPERDPGYELPSDLDGTASAAPTLTRAEYETWRRMVRRRPLLACLMED